MPLEIIACMSDRIVKMNLEMMSHFSCVCLIRCLIENIYKDQYFSISFPKFH
jgi:hypothetical protein